MNSFTHQIQCEETFAPSVDFERGEVVDMEIANTLSFLEMIGMAVSLHVLMNDKEAENKARDISRQLEARLFWLENDSTLVS